MFPSADVFTMQTFNMTRLVVVAAQHDVHTGRIDFDAYLPKTIANVYVTKVLWHYINDQNYILAVYHVHFFLLCVPLWAVCVWLGCGGWVGGWGLLPPCLVDFGPENSIYHLIWASTDYTDDCIITLPEKNAWTAEDQDIVFYCNKLRWAELGQVHRNCFPSSCKAALSCIQSEQESFSS